MGEWLPHFHYMDWDFRRGDAEYAFLITPWGTIKGALWDVISFQKKYGRLADIYPEAPLWVNKDNKLGW